MGDRSPAPDISPLQVQRQRRCATRLAATFTLAGLALSLCFACLSDGAHHDDDLTHYQMAAWSSTYPAFLLHDWGRPGFTALYALPAQMGWLPARWLSGVLTAAAAWLAFLCARHLRVPAAWAAPALVWLQPYTFTLSYTTLTETPMAFYLALAYWLLLTRRFAASAAIISVGLLTRHEAVLFAAIWAVALWRQRRPWRDWLWLAWAPVLHNLLSGAFTGYFPLMKFLEPRPTNEYGSGEWDTMLIRWLMAAGMGIVILSVAGAATLTRRRQGWIAIAAIALFVSAQTVFFRFGLFASGGYERFFVPLAPMVAIAAAAGMTDIRGKHARWSGLLRRSLFLLATFASGAIAIEEMRTNWYVQAHAGGQAELVVGLFCFWITLLGVAELVFYFAALLYLATRNQSKWLESTTRWSASVVSSIAVLLALYQPIQMAMFAPLIQICVPLRLTPIQQSQLDAIAWIRSAALADRTLHYASPWYNHFLRRIEIPRVHPTGSILDEIKPGELALWDPWEFASPRHGGSLERVYADGRFRELWRSKWSIGHVPCAIVFECQPEPSKSPAEGDPSD